jgi:uncharacterized protein (UPF0303 family)
VRTTGGFSSLDLLHQERLLTLPSLELPQALEIGELAKMLGAKRNLPIAIEVRLFDWVVYHVSLMGSSIDNQFWIDRKARVVLLKHHSTLFERVSSEERSIDWFKVNEVSENEYAIHGGGLPLITESEGFIGSLLISGLPQVEDHLFGVEVLSNFLGYKV